MKERETAVNSAESSFSKFFFEVIIILHIFTIDKGSHLGILGKSEKGKEERRENGKRGIV